MAVAQSASDQLTLTAGETTVVVIPRRGAIVTSFRVGERELLYLDPSTLANPATNVRGGIPVLFPSPGKLDGDAWERDGLRGSMKQHGFARTLPWSMVNAGARKIELCLASDETTMAQFPWAFRATLTFEVDDTGLRIVVDVENTGTRRLPFGLGFHPYFAVKNKAKTTIDTRATRAFDNVTKRIVPFTGFDLTSKEVDLHLLDHGSTHSAIHLDDGARIDVRASVDFARWVVWTVQGKDFVCLEPWTCPGNALNTGEGLITVEPGSTYQTWIAIALTPSGGSTTVHRAR